MDQAAANARQARRHRELEMLRYVASVSRGEMSRQRRATIALSRRIMLCSLFLMMFLALCGLLHEMFA